MEKILSQVFYWSVLIVVTIGTITATIALSWWLVNAIVRMLGAYVRVADAIWNAAAYRKWKKEQEENR